MFLFRAHLFGSNNRFFSSSSEYQIQALLAEQSEQSESTSDLYVKTPSDTHDSHHVHLRDIYRGPLNIVWMNLYVNSVLCVQIGFLEPRWYFYSLHLKPPSSKSV